MKVKLEYLESLLETVKKETKDLETAYFYQVNLQPNKKVSLTVELEAGGISNLTGFYTYREMEVFLQGILFLQRRLKTK
jgi:hypothetical protein